MSNNNKGSLIHKKNVLRQRPRLLYAGSNNNGEGWLNTAHTHEQSEIILIKQGSGKIKIENTTYPFATGDLIIINKNVNHCEFFDHVEGRELLFFGFGNLHISGLESDCLLKDKPFIIIPTKSYFSNLCLYMQSLIAESENPQPFSDAVCDHLVKILLMLILRIAAFDAELTFKQNSAYIEAKEYFDKNFTTIDSLDNVCKTLFINKYYLTHVFSEQMGMPPIKYLINKRIELACHHLETSDMNINDVSAACGYVDTAYFCRVFKNVMNVTPLRYRYNYKEKLKQNQ